MIHHLKANKRHWSDYKSGLKNNSMRLDDRHFAVGDICIIQLWEDEKFILNEMVVKKVTHILHSWEFKHLKDGYCILSLKDV